MLCRILIPVRAHSCVCTRGFLDSCGQCCYKHWDGSVYATSLPRCAKHGYHMQLVNIDYYTYWLAKSNNVLFILFQIALSPIHISHKAVIFVLQYIWLDFLLCTLMDIFTYSTPLIYMWNTTKIFYSSLYLDITWYFVCMQCCLLMNKSATIPNITSHDETYYKIYTQNA